MSLSQIEADDLLMMSKRFSSNNELVLGDIPIDITRELSSLDLKESFLLDIWRNGFNLSKFTFQNRSRVIYTLVRVDFGGSLHQNPDGNIVHCPHIHLYREGYNDKWAYPISDYSEFKNSNNLVTALQDFSNFCHIIQLPPIQLSHV